MCAQLVHAAGETGPVPEGTYAVVLSAESEEHLSCLANKLESLNIPHKCIYEPDYDNQLMSIGVYPVQDRSLVNRVFGQLPLLRGDSIVECTS